MSHHDHKIKDTKLTQWKEGLHNAQKILKSLHVHVKSSIQDAASSLRGFQEALGKKVISPESCLP